MVDGANAPISETPRQKLAASRASGDIQLANEAARAAAQAAILINGGAATAILAYLSKDAHTPPSILSAASWSLMGYAIGVFCGAIALWCASLALSQTGRYQMAILYDDQIDIQRRFLELGNRFSAITWLSPLACCFSSFQVLGLLGVSYKRLRVRNRCRHRQERRRMGKGVLN
jgi:hypothetical protein